MEVLSNILWRGSVIVVFWILDELHLSGESSVLLLNSAVSLLFNLVDLFGLGLFLFKVINIKLLYFDLLLEFSQQSVLLLNCLRVELEFFLQSFQSFMQLHLVCQNVIIGFFLSA